MFAIDTNISMSSEFSLVDTFKDIFGFSSDISNLNFPKDASEFSGNTKYFLDETQMTNRFDNYFFSPITFYSPHQIDSEDNNVEKLTFRYLLTSPSCDSCRNQDSKYPDFEYTSDNLNYNYDNYKKELELVKDLKLEFETSDVIEKVFSDFDFINLNLTPSSPINYIYYPNIYSEEKENEISSKRILDPYSSSLLEKNYYYESGRYNPSINPYLKSSKKETFLEDRTKPVKSYEIFEKLPVFVLNYNFNYDSLTLEEKEVIKYYEKYPLENKIALIKRTPDELGKHFSQETLQSMLEKRYLIPRAYLNRAIAYIKSDYTFEKESTLKFNLNNIYNSLESLHINILKDGAVVYPKDQTEEKYLETHEDLDFYKEDNFAGINDLGELISQEKGWREVPIENYAKFRYFEKLDTYDRCIEDNEHTGLYICDFSFVESKETYMNHFVKNAHTYNFFFSEFINVDESESYNKVNYPEPSVNKAGLQGRTIKVSDFYKKFSKEINDYEIYSRYYLFYYDNFVIKFNGFNENFVNFEISFLDLSSKKHVLENNIPCNIKQDPFVDKTNATPQEQIDSDEYVVLSCISENSNGVKTVYYYDVFNKYYVSQNVLEKHNFTINFNKKIGESEFKKVSRNYVFDNYIFEGLGGDESRFYFTDNYVVYHDAILKKYTIFQRNTFPEKEFSDSFETSVFNKVSNGNIDFYVRSLDPISNNVTLNFNNNSIIYNYDRNIFENKANKKLLDLNVSVNYDPEIKYNTLVVNTDQYNLFFEEKSINEKVNLGSKLLDDDVSFKVGSGMDLLFSRKASSDSYDFITFNCNPNVYNYCDKLNNFYNVYNYFDFDLQNGYDFKNLFIGGDIYLETPFVSLFDYNSSSSVIDYKNIVDVNLGAALNKDDQIVFDIKNKIWYNDFLISQNNNLPISENKKIEASNENVVNFIFGKPYMCFKVPFTGLYVDRFGAFMKTYGCTYDGLEVGFPIRESYGKTEYFDDYYYDFDKDDWTEIRKLIFKDSGEINFSAIPNENKSGDISYNYANNMYNFKIDGLDNLNYVFNYNYLTPEDFNDYILNHAKLIEGSFIDENVNYLTSNDFNFITISDIYFEDLDLTSLNDVEKYNFKRKMTDLSVLNDLKKYNKEIHFNVNIHNLDNSYSRDGLNVTAYVDSVEKRGDSYYAILKENVYSFKDKERTYYFNFEEVKLPKLDLDYNIVDNFENSYADIDYSKAIKEIKTNVKLEHITEAFDYLLLLGDYDAIPVKTDVLFGNLASDVHMEIYNNFKSLTDFPFVLDNLYYGNVDDDKDVELNVGRLTFEEINDYLKYYYKNLDFDYGRYKDKNELLKKYTHILYPDSESYIINVDRFINKLHSIGFDFKLDLGDYKLNNVHTFNTEIFDEIPLFKNSIAESENFLEKSYYPFKVSPSKDELVSDFYNMDQIYFISHGGPNLFAITDSFGVTKDLFTIDYIDSYLENRPVIFAQSCLTGVYLGREFLDRGASNYLASYNSLHINYDMFPINIYNNKLSNLLRLTQNAYINSEENKQNGLESIFLLGDPSISFRPLNSNINQSNLISVSKDNILEYGLYAYYSDDEGFYVFLDPLEKNNLLSKKIFRSSVDISDLKIMYFPKIGTIFTRNLLNKDGEQTNINYIYFENDRGKDVILNYSYNFSKIKFTSSYPYNKIYPYKEPENNNYRNFWLYEDILNQIRLNPNLEDNKNYSFILEKHYWIDKYPLSNYIRNRADQWKKYSIYFDEVSGYVLYNENDGPFNIFGVYNPQKNLIFIPTLYINNKFIKKLEYEKVNDRFFIINFDYSDFIDLIDKNIFTYGYEIRIK